MMSTMLPAAVLMAETVVDLMSIQLFAQYANVNKQEEEEEDLEDLDVQQSQHG